MDTKVAVISIIVNERKATEQLNALLHEYGQYIIGRLGLPYKEKNINIICIAVDAPEEKVNSLTDAIDQIPDINATVTYAKQ